MAAAGVKPLPGVLLLWLAALPAASGTAGYHAECEVPADGDTVSPCEADCIYGAPIGCRSRISHL
jgi:hypothetical protein